MATYLEIRNLFSDGDLKNKATVAIVKYAESLLTGTPSANEKKFALDVINDPKLWGDRALQLILAANSGSSVAAIQGASDTVLQSNIDDIGSYLVDANAGA